MIVQHTSAYDALIDFITAHLRPEEILQFQLPFEIEQRIDHLLEKNSSGYLTEQERAELEEFARAEHMMRRLKLQALTRQEQS